MKLPPLLYERPAPAEFMLAVVVPVLFGLATGFVLGASEPVYLVLSLMGILGGFFAGLEHDRPLEGMYRGILGGVLFGSSILLANGLAGVAPKAHLPDPETLLIVITTVAGGGLGTLGARMRVRAEQRHAVVSGGA